MAARIFYPAASLYAALVLPVSVLAMTGALRWPGLATGPRHAHEMLFGFALAVVAGNQLGPLPRWQAAGLVALWATARGAFLWALPLPAALANVVFVILLGVFLVPRRLKAVKKLRNFALPGVLAAICLGEIAFEAAELSRHALVASTVLREGVLLFALLMLFMGGRIIAPAVAGEFYRKGGNLEARVQPNVEGGIIAGMLVAIVSMPLVPLVGALGCIVSGVLAAVRMSRWRLWECRGRPDLLCLSAGYAWLSLGLVLFGGALAFGQYATIALHFIMIGALGTLTLNVMAYSWMAKARLDPARVRLPVAGTLLLGAATLARSWAGFMGPEGAPLLWAAATCWSGAFVLLLILFGSARSRGR